MNDTIPASTRLAPHGAAAPAARLHSLDALRGIAALTVVFWHWSHFFYVGTEPGLHVESRFPLDAIFHPLYAKGWLAVDLFFLLSGFIFFWLYAAPIREKRVSPSTFAALRFSRLYPLHLVTLLAVAAAQAGFRRFTGSDFVYGWNDFRHFGLNLAFASSWGFERGYSFNAPAWSVSIEVLLYALFFVLCRLTSCGFVVLGALSAFGHLAIERVNPALGSGFGSFFLGGFVQLLHDRLVRAGRAGSAARPLVALTVVAWAVAGVALHRHWNLFWISTLGVFPVTVLTLATLESAGAGPGPRLGSLGDVSYSSYLLHFPLQLAVVGLTTWLGVSRDVFYSPLALVAFFAVLLVLSRASFRFLEMPPQRWLRGKLVPGRARAGDLDAGATPSGRAGEARVRAAAAPGPALAAAAIHEPTVDRSAPR